MRRWRQRAASRITFNFALRGTIAVMVPFAALFALGLPSGGVLAALGGLYATFADAGGAYRQRLGHMLLALMVGAICLFIGSALPPVIWLVSLVLALIAFVSGMARVFTGPSISLGICANILFLVGAYAPDTVMQSAISAGFYAIGCGWAISVQLAFWRFRPYRLLLEQVAACYDAAAQLVALLEAPAAGAKPLKRGRQIRRHHAQVRETIRQAQATLESLRRSAAHTSPLFDRAALWLAAVSRETIAATSLQAIHRPAPLETERWHEWFQSWKAALEAISQFLLKGRGEIPVAPARAAFEALQQQRAIPDGAQAPLKLALLYLETIAQAHNQPGGLHFAWGQLLPKLRAAPWRRAAAKVTAQISFHSIIFRHALRLAVAMGFGMWLGSTLQMTHPLWVPLAIILILQPAFGATWQKLWQRLGGTLVGVLVAGALYSIVGSGVGILPLIAIFAFATFFFIRTHYGLSIMAITPLILFLLAVLMPQESDHLIIARAMDTALGGAIAIAAAYLLWPLWQRDFFLPQCAKALRGHRDYLAIAFDPSFGYDTRSHTQMMQARHRAELAGDNATLILNQLLSEPQSRRPLMRGAIGLNIYLHRLANNASRFDVQLRDTPLLSAQRAWGQTILQQLDTVVDVLEDNTKVDELKSVSFHPHPDAGHQPLTPCLEHLAADAAMLALAAGQLLGVDRS